MVKGETVENEAVENEAVRRWIAAAARVVVLTGAGISTDSGIADFRGPQGLWTKNPEAEKRADIRYYLSDPEIRKAAWLARLESPVFAAEPNPGHLALVGLERRGNLLAIVTQNVDGLHQKAGSDPAKVLEVHGTAHWVKCWSCGETAPMERALDRVRAGEEDPPCRTCGGILKSATISFGQSLDPDVIDAAQRAAVACDLLLAVGSTLAVYPAAGLVPLAAQTRARVVIVNNQPTDFDELADAVIRRPISEVLPQLVASDPGA
ncbi:MAG: NAD-dependent deacetylase [Actinobacteria bacterium]|nr:NAD-dependent deacetylase [Actinomycetota bacterium]